MSKSSLSKSASKSAAARRRRPRRKTPALRHLRRLLPLARFIGLLGAVVVVAYLLISGIEKLIRPYWLGHTYNQELAQLRSRQQQKRARVARLEEQVRFLRSPEGIEQSARRDYGYVRPGEEVLLLPADKPATGLPARAVDNVDNTDAAQPAP